MKYIFCKVITSLVLLLMTLGISDVYGQLFDDFSDGELTTNPKWVGDLEDYRINEMGRLQLAAADAGSSILLTSYMPVGGGLEWSMDIWMDFAPSNNNNLKVVLYMDDLDLSKARGYYIQIGENGSDDTVELYAFDGSAAFLMGRGGNGLLADKPVRLRLRIVRDEGGTWGVYTDRDFTGTQFKEFEVFDDELKLDTIGYFYIHCAYTKSNTEAFIFDNILAQSYTSDQTGPQIVSVTVPSSRELIVQFDESLEESSALDPQNYSIGGITPIAVELVDLRRSSYRLIFEDELENGVTQWLTTRVKDILGNLSEASYELWILIPEIPVEGDILVNEILFNPLVGGVDFVELINVSEKYIALNALYIENLLGGSSISKRIDSDRILFPGEILAVAKDTAIILDHYPATEYGRLVENELPRFNADTGNVTLVWRRSGLTDVVLDSFNYSEDWHHPLLSEVKGVSLERISIELPSVEATTWSSAAGTVGYGTPGMPNSQEIMLSSSIEEVVLSPLTFSPDADGVDDYLLIRIRPESRGVIGRIKIFDARGNFVRELVNNRLLGTDQLVRWDGTDAQGRKSRTGAYVINIEYFDTDGNHKIYTKSVVLASVLN